MLNEPATQAVCCLREGGVVNPLRLVKLIKETIALLKLQLSGLTVLTEAASGPYVVTPVIAALAGARRVIAMTQDSRYARAATVTTQTRMLERLCDIEGRVEIITSRQHDLFAQADLVTNLGFVRPLDAASIRAMKPTAVIPLMCEAWEYRQSDLDLEACRRHGIAVLATNEDYPNVEVFTYSGFLCMKMLFAAQIEIHQSKILVISSDKFGKVITQQLCRAGANVSLAPTLREVSMEELRFADALVIADYCRQQTIIGPDGDRTASDLAQINPGLTVISFAGMINVPGLQKNGIVVYPAVPLPSHRMGLTLASLGPKPVVALHAAGLKVGEVLARARKLYDVESAMLLALEQSPAQRL